MCHFWPIAGLESGMHGARNFADLPEVVEDALVAVDVGLEDFPIVDARLSRRSGVNQHESRLNVCRRDRDRLSVNAVNVQVNRVHSAVQSWVVVLTAGRYADQLGFDVLRNLANLFSIDFAIGELRECCDGHNHQCGGSRDSSSGRRFRVCFQCKTTTLREAGAEKEPYQMRSQIVLNLLCPAEFVEITEVVFAARIDRFEMNLRIVRSRELTASENVDGKV